MALDPKVDEVSWWNILLLFTDANTVWFTQSICTWNENKSEQDWCFFLSREIATITAV